MRIFLPTLLASFAGFTATSVSALELSDLSLGGSFTVDSLLDVPDINPGDGICLAEGSVCTLRAAVMEANAGDASVRYDIVIAVEGEFELISSDLVDDDGQGAEDDDSDTGDLDIAANLHIQGLKYTVPVDGADDKAMQTVIQAALLGRTIDIHQSPSWQYAVGLKDVTLKGTGTSVGSVVRNYGHLELDSVAITEGGSTKSALYHQGGLLSVHGGVFGGVARAIEVASGRVEITGGAVFSGLDSRDAVGGSAVLLRRGTLAVDDALFDSNASKNYGGVIRVMEGAAVIRNAAFTDNSSANGGAIYSSGHLIIKDGVTFEGNSAGKIGGAIYSESGLSVVEDTEFLSNVSSLCGGAVYVSGDASANFSRVTMVGNKAAVNLAVDYSSVFGGAMCLDARNDLHPVFIQDSTFSANGVSADSESGQSGVGGAIYMKGYTHIKRSSFSLNSAHRGGALHSSGAGNTIQNSTFYLNKTTETAGAILNADGGELALSFSTFLHNRAVEGGAIHLQNDAGELSLKGVLLQGDGDRSDSLDEGAFGDAFCVGEVTSMGWNLSGDESCSLSLVTDQADVQLEQLHFVENSDAPDGMALIEEHHAVVIDAVPQAHCPSFDQRTYLRGAGKCDVGAWELAGESYVVPEVQFDFQTGLAAESGSNYGIGLSLTPEVISGETVTAEIIVIDLGSAVEGEDFITQDAKTFVWGSDSDSNQTFNLTLLDDYVKEVAHELGDYERVAFLLANMTGVAKIGSSDWFELNISESDDVASGEFRLASAKYSALEQVIDDSADTEANAGSDSDDGAIEIDILRSNGSEGAVTLRYATEAMTATSDSDYEEMSDEVTFAEGETVKTVTLDFINDSKVEADETFRFVIRPEISMEKYTAIGVPSAAVITIIDDDTAPAELDVDDDAVRSDLIKRSASGSFGAWGLGFLLSCGLYRYRRVARRFSAND